MTPNQIKDRIAQQTAKGVANLYASARQREILEEFWKELTKDLKEKPTSR